MKIDGMICVFIFASVGVWELITAIAENKPTYYGGAFACACGILVICTNEIIYAIKKSK